MHWNNSLQSVGFSKAVHTLHTGGIHDVFLPTICVKSANVTVTPQVCSSARRCVKLSSRKVNNNLQCEPFWDSNRTVIGWCWFHRIERILFIDRSYATNDICRSVHKFLAGKMYLVFHCWCRAIALKRNFEPLTPYIFPFEAEVLFKDYMQQNFSNKNVLMTCFCHFLCVITQNMLQWLRKSEDFQMPASIP